MSEVIDQSPNTPLDVLRNKSKETAENLSREMENMKQGLAVSLLGLSTEQQSQLFEYLRDFGNGTWSVREGKDFNKQRAERVVTAVGAASALVAVEPSPTFYQERAQKASDLLKDRYGVSPKQK